MAFAMIWIMLFHMEVSTGMAGLDRFLNTGYAGTDVFFFLSGIGIWFSLEKSKSTGEYYKKRFVRIMPMYWCFIGFWIAFRVYCFGMSMPCIIANILGIETLFDMDMGFNWYIAFLMIFYLVAPVIKKLLKLLPLCLGTVLIAVVFFALGYFVIQDSNLMIGVARVPIFVLGMQTGQIISKDKEGGFSVYVIAILMALVPVGYGLAMHFGADFMHSWNNGMMWYPLFLSTPGFCVLICLLFSLLPDSLAKPFDFMGRYTFSIYMIHVFFYEVYLDYFVKNGILERTWWHWLVIWLLVALGCVFLELITGAVTGLFTAKKDTGVSA